MWILIGLIMGANCWWNTGHELVAKIASIDLIENGHYEVFDHFDKILKTLKGFTQESDHIWDEAAIWPDQA